MFSVALILFFIQGAVFNYFILATFLGVILLRSFFVFFVCRSTFVDEHNFYFGSKIVPAEEVNDLRARSILLLNEEYLVVKTISGENFFVLIGGRPILKTLVESFNGRDVASPREELYKLLLSKGKVSEEKLKQELGL